MGMNKDSMGIKTTATGLVIQKKSDSDRVIALAGNPNVGKSTVFNGLTGLNQHTGNWPGKTVANAQGYCSYEGQGFVFVDIPGCYSLMAHSTEEEVARDFICFEEPDAVVVVCDATCLDRNMNLVLQILEATDQVVVCVNLMDEAAKKGIEINFDRLREKLGVPVLGITARSKKGLKEILEEVKEITEVECGQRCEQCCACESRVQIIYPDYIEEAAAILESSVEPFCRSAKRARWLSLRLLDSDESFQESLRKTYGRSFYERPDILSGLEKVKALWKEKQISNEQAKDAIASAFVKKAEEITEESVAEKKHVYNRKDRRLDWIFTSKLTGFPIMFLLLLFIFWLTITGANYPSQLLSRGLFWIEDQLTNLCIQANVPQVVYGVLITGIYRVVAWVVSVMLPPMAIFFPLFTLLEDFGYLPRVAFNLDRCFKKCHACGKQALTMCMGYVNL